MEISRETNLTDDFVMDAEFPNTFQLITEGWLIFLIGCIGLFGNVISIWTFSRQPLHRIFHNLLLVLTIYDTVRQ